MRCEEAGPLLADFREQALDEADRIELERHLQQCEACRTDLATLDALAGSARDWRDAPVPAWHRTAFAVPERGARQWLPWLSLATSTLCLVLILTGVDVQGDANGFRVRFGPGRVGPAVALNAQELEQRLDLFEQQQFLAIGNRLAAWDIERQQDNRKLMGAVLEYSRGQQRQDLARFLGYWKAVRDNDQAQQALVLGELLSSQQESERELRAIKASMNYTIDEEYR
jgi:hypothetical protein